MKQKWNTQKEDRKMLIGQDTYERRQKLMKDLLKVEGHRGEGINRNGTIKVKKERDLMY